jgi:hypothetical protein
MGWLRRTSPFPSRSEGPGDGPPWAFTLSDLEYEGELLVRSLRIAATSVSRRASIARIVLISLGALTATKAAADQLWGAESAGVVTSYALIGVLVATIAGLLAAFKWEDNAAQLRLLVAESGAWERALGGQYQRLRGSEPEEAWAIVGEHEMTLRNFERKAAEVGVIAERPLSEGASSSAEPD